ncbi:DUF2288 domain-containing protein [Methylomonas methanica]|uniref:DUF2288 domain-containing protein n=1 Tax=Methylomonas methanica (strain DSM 25384 / MC09) TaxID=857087 RepID=F9ZYI0_METMM|nr:DUF2288 domain-containing protein [Methylomonas methanica]AEG02252.1 Protein of unknown function DUF2288 [Methylomonas methanica MC09]
MTDSLRDLEKTKLNQETSLISWLELQRFFAAGLAISVEKELDLVEVAYQFSIDNKQIVNDWLQAKRIAPVSDQLARDWFENKADVWAVVVKPWILVQDATTRPSAINH